MKTIIFSDTHLTHKFDEGRYKFLRGIISHADKVIINGDFWDYYWTTFNSFINSKWNQLFPLLKAKNTLYLYGNHDTLNWCNDKISLFSSKQNRKVTLKVGKKKLIITHGDIFSPGLDNYAAFYPALAEKGSQAFTSIETLGRTLLGEYFALGKLSNLRIRKFAQKYLQTNEILVCGHTHNLEYSPIQHYMNLGSIDFGMGQYLEINNNKIDLKNEKY